MNIYAEIFFSAESQLFYSSFEKFPPEIIKKVEELKSQDKWQTFLAVGNFLANGGSIGGTALTEMVEKNITLEIGNHEEFTPLGKIIWFYRNIFEKLQ